MKLIPEQVQILTEKLKHIRKSLEGYNDYFSELHGVSGDRNYTIDSGNNRVTASQYHFLEQQRKEYEDYLKTANRIQEIDTDKIELGTKFHIHFDGEEEKEEFTLVDNSLGLSMGHISTTSDIGKAIFHLREKDRFVIVLEDGTKVSGEVTDIITNPKEYVNYIIKTPVRNRVSRLAKSKKTLTLTNSQRDLLKLERNLLKEKLSKEEQEKLMFHIGTKVTLKIGATTPKTYMIVDKKEKDIDPECEISIDSSLIDRMYHRKEDGKFYIYTGKIRKSSSKKIARVLEINQENVYSEEEKKKTIKTLKTRITCIEKLLNTSTLCHPEENEEAIGIGSKVRLTIQQGTEIEEKEVEIIQRAVSYELDSEYIESISPLGARLLGKQVGDVVNCPMQSETYKATINEIVNEKQGAKGLIKQ